MNNKKALVAALAVTTMLAGGFAYAANENPSTQSAKQEAAADTDATKLSVDASQAFRDVTATRLAIFDGRIDDAKKDVGRASASFDKAKSDRSVFMKAEADLKLPATLAGQVNAGKTGTDSANAPVAWLPVDGDIILGEDYSASPQKTAAVAEANKTLAHNDRKGAVEKLKLAGVDVDYVVAVIPVDQTLTDVHKAVEMMNDGKYYEASQMLRAVQTGMRFDVLDVTMTPKASTAMKTPAPGEKAPQAH